MKKIYFALTSILFSTAAFAVGGGLVSEETNGSVKYCKYSNGAIVTIQSYQVCPTWNGG